MPGLLRGVARVAIASGTATAVSNRVSRRQEERWARQDYERQAAYQPPQPAPAAAAPAAYGADPVQQLKDLAALKQQGAITEEEFASQKARILGE